MNDQQFAAERGRRAADLRAAATALLEQQAIAAGVMLDLDSDQVVAAGPKSAILYLLNQQAATAPHGSAAPTESAPTEISAQLREYASNPGYSHNDYADVMRRAADECDRFYGGMMAWKRTAEKKDRDWNEARMTFETYKCAQRAAAPVSSGSYLCALCNADVAGVSGKCAACWNKPERAAVVAAKVPTDEIAKLQKRIKWLETLADAYGPKSLQYDIEHPNDGLNAAKPVEQGQGAAPSEKAAASADGLPPVEHDKSMDRWYVPLPGGWEIQTKGNGSSFRIAHAPSGRRWIVMDDQLHDPLVALANAVRAERTAPVGAGVVPDWQECERISDLPAVHEALYAFTHDPTADNGTCVVRAVLESVATAHPVAADDQVRDQALEEAAQACDSYAKAAMPEYRNDANGALCCARNIRALKSRTTAHGGAQGEQTDPQEGGAA